MMAKKEQVPVIRFQGFADPWEQRKLGELGTITTGNTPSTSIPDYYSDDGIVWVTPTDICENITFESARKLSDLGQQVGRVVPKNTILVTCIASIGKNTMLGNTGSFNQQINGLTPNENKYDPYFLLTESALWSAKMKGSAAAGTMQIVNRTEFSELKTWLPSLIEQQAIGAFFKQLDHLITLHQRKYDKLVAIKRSMLEKMFPREGSRFPEIRFAGFTDPWEQRKLGEVSKRVIVGLATSVTPYYREKGAPILRNLNIKENYLDDTDILFLDRTYAESQISKQIHAGDVLTVHTGYIGTSCVVPEKYDKCLTFTTLITTTDESVLKGAFLSQYLNSEIGMSAVQAVTTQGGRQNLNTNDFVKVEIRYPSLAEQNKICTVLSSIDNLITLHQRKLEKLQAIKRSMLEKMFV